MELICNFMHRGTVTCRLDDTAQDVAELMNDNQIRTVVVVDERGGFWGVISVLDLLPAIGKNLGKVSAEDLMQPCQFTVDPQLPVNEAVALMDKHQVEYLVIGSEGTSEKRPVGILTSYDIVRCMARIKVGRTVGPLKLAAG